MERPKTFVGHHLNFFTLIYCFLLVSIRQPFNPSRRRDSSARGTGLIRSAKWFFMATLSLTFVVDLRIGSGIRSHRVMPRYISHKLSNSLKLDSCLVQRWMVGLLFPRNFASLLRRHITHPRCSAILSFKGCIL